MQKDFNVSGEWGSGVGCDSIKQGRLHLIFIHHSFFEVRQFVFFRQVAEGGEPSNVLWVKAH